MWSLRYLIVTLDILPPCIPKADSENAERLKSWQQVCINLGVHLPPSQLILHIYVGEDGGWSGNQIALAKGALGSMLKLPILKEVFFEITPILKFFEIHRMATTMINRLTSSHSESDSHFRFMDLPREIQIMILCKHLVAPSPVMVTL
jgi:hypothetical protein